MKKALAVGLAVVLLGFAGMARTQFFDAVYIEGAFTLSGTAATAFTGTTFSVTASTSAIFYTPNFTVGYDSGAYIKFAVADATGDLTITHAGSSKAVSWTAAGGFTFSGGITDLGTVAAGTWEGDVVDHERGGLEADVNAYDGLVKISGGTTSAVTVTTFAESILDDSDEATFKATVNLEIGTDVEAQDAELDALAALTFADDKIILGTGAGTIGVADCTVFAQSILDDADEATFKATTNLEIGTDVQAYDAELDDIAGLTFADDKIILGTGAGTVGVADCTVFAQSILDDADEATFKATVNLEAGTDVQAYDVELAALAGLTSAANAIPYFTGSGTAGVISSSADVVSFLGAANTAAMVTALSLTIGTNTQAWDADLDTYAGITPSANLQTFMGSADFAAMRTNLSLVPGTDVQVYDAELLALAGLASAANAIPYFTGSETAGVISSSANMVSLLGSADYAAARTALSLVPGTNVQAQDDELDDIAGLTFADDKIIIGTGAGTIDLADCTVFAQSILDDADEATFKATVNLEIGTDVQAHDDELTDVAGLTFADDKIIIGTGAGTIDMADCTVFAQSILDDADEATFKATVNLEADTDFNAYDADLTTYAGITPTAAAQTTLGNAADAIVLCQRHRVTIAEINAGHTLLPQISGKSYRLVSCKAIAYGGAAGDVTTVDLLGTQSSSGVKLVAYAQAQLTQSTVVYDGLTGGTVLADGASYQACDANTAITAGKTGSDVTTATGVDFVIEYVIE